MITENHSKDDSAEGDDHMQNTSIQQDHNNYSDEKPDHDSKHKQITNIMSERMMKNLNIGNIDIKDGKSLTYFQSEKPEQRKKRLMEEKLNITID